SSLDTAWTSASAGVESATVDLGQKSRISRIRITWGTSYATSYDIRGSETGTASPDTWTLLKQVTSKSSSAADDWVNLAPTATAQYVAIICKTASGSNYIIKDLA